MQITTTASFSGEGGVTLPVSPDEAPEVKMSVTGEGKKAGALLATG